MQVVSGVRADDVNESAKHTLFVEGGGDGAIDPTVMRRLFADTPIRIQALGTSSSIKSAAQALHAHHPCYYFVIDRDHHDKGEVDDSWSKFPRPDTHNLIIWRRRELENYFLDPNYLAKSDFRKASANIEQELLSICRERIFFDAANQVIVKVRESQKKTWISEFTNPVELSTKDLAVQKLRDCRAFHDRSKSVANAVRLEEIEQQFEDVLAAMLERSSVPEFDQGQWLSLMKGKPILNALVTKCFVVKDSSGRILAGKEAVSRLAEDLLTKGIFEQPEDFQELHSLMVARVLNAK